MYSYSSIDCVIIWGPDATGQVWVREDLTEAVPEGKAFLAAAAHLGVVGFWSFLCQLC